MGMFPLLIPPAQVQDIPAPPPGVELPPTLRPKPGSLELFAFDEEAFDVRSTPGKGPLRLNVEGRTWRFVLVAAEGRMGVLTLVERLKTALVATGWIWQFEERGVARREVDGQEWWLRFTPGSSGELKVVVVERREPRALSLARPAAIPELPKPREDFPYLPPWPGSRIVSCTDSPNPVAVELIPGKPIMVKVNFIEKEYDLAEPVSAHEFLAVYSKALMNAGWEIEGRFRGTLIQIQAVFSRDGRDIRATLRLLGTAMAISVGDVGAQRPQAK